MSHMKPITAALLAGLSGLAVTASAQAQEEIQFINCGANDGEAPALQTEHINAWLAENPGYTVTEEYVPWGQCQERAITLASAGDPPALAYLGSRTLPQLAESELILPIPASDELINSYRESVRSTVQFDGQMWGLPRAFSTKALFINATLFEEAGVEAPTTWEETVAAAQAISEGTEAAGIGIPAASFDNTMHQWLSWFYSNGAEVIDAEGNVVIDSPEAIAAFQLYADLAPYAQDGPVAYDRAELEPLFQNGQIAMMIHGYSFAARAGDVDWQIIPVPAGPNGDHSTLLITDSLAVFDGSGQEEAAMSLAMYLTAPERQAVFDDTAGWTPIRESEFTAALRENDANWAFFLDTIEIGGPEPQMVDFLSMQDVINEALQGVILGELTAEEAATQAAEELRDLQDG
ncbi:sugar ABC transporter substrate-binding protein [Gymnodinialimonas sp. 2305UL16-5]|uniref:ABC transporter substrate-binding protein n=1 Tax=Gymnodinialimonas mytili TaxID=3126503 RepID=UPI00309FC1E0